MQHTQSILLEVQDESVMDGLDTTYGHIFYCHFQFARYMGIWEAFRPGGGPRVGILRFETTRGDRLFLSLLGSAFIHLAWLLFATANLWWALGVSLLYAALVFSFV